MRKSVIIYASRHHGSTEKLVKHLASQFAIDLINAEEIHDADLSGYDIIGFASGIDFGKFYPSVTDYSRLLPQGKRIFAVYTCARDNDKYGMEIAEIAQKCGCHFIGKFGCRGYNTYGPWKIIGGMNKNHPNDADFTAVCTFYKNIMA